jgi:Domain of unknown function (DUF4349)
MWRSALLLVALVPACSEAPSSDSSPVANSAVVDVSAPPSPSMSVEKTAPSMEQSVSLPAAVTGRVQGASEPMQRLIVRTASMRVQVTSVQTTVKEVAALLRESNGFLGASRLWRDGERDHASLTLRVPAEKLDATLVRLRDLSVRVDDESMTGEDVTRQAVDLNAQLTNLRATEVELRALLTTVRQNAKRAADVLEVHNELSNVRGQIEQHTASLQSLTQLAALSTIQLELSPDVVTSPIATEQWQPQGVFRDATRALLSTLRVGVNATIWAIVYGLPVLLLLGGAFLGVRQLRKRVRSGMPVAP